MDPPPPPQRKGFDTNNYFELIGVSEILGEPKLCYTEHDPLLVKIEYFQAQEFTRNYN